MSMNQMCNETKMYGFNQGFLLLFAVSPHLQAPTVTDHDGPDAAVTDPAVTQHDQTQLEIYDFQNALLKLTIELLVAVFATKPASNHELCSPLTTTQDRINRRKIGARTESPHNNHIKDRFVGKAGDAKEMSPRRRGRRPLAPVPFTDPAAASCYDWDSTCSGGWRASLEERRSAERLFHCGRHAC